MVLKWWWLGRVLVCYSKSSWTGSKMTTPQISSMMQVVIWKSTPSIGSLRDSCPYGWLLTSDRFHENNHKTCSSSFKTSSYPSLRNTPKHVSNLIVSCAEFLARPPSCSSPYSWEPLLCSSLTKISLPTKKNKQQFQNVDPLFFHLPCLLIQASPYLRYISQKCVSRH